jgi:hypothetical protein
VGRAADERLQRAAGCGPAEGRKIPEYGGIFKIIYPFCRKGTGIAPRPRSRTQGNRIAVVCWQPRIGALPFSPKRLTVRHPEDARHA